MSDKTTIVESENTTETTKETNKYDGATNNRVFNENATADLNVALSQALANGENPSAKYLRQEIISKSLPESISKFVKEIVGFMEFVDSGKGVEYILTTLGTITKMNPSAFVPTEVYEMSNDTYVDSMDLPEISSAKTKAMERSVQLYKYVQYYLSGKANEVANIIRSYMNDSLLLSVFQDVLAIIQRMYAVISAKTGTDTNFVVGTASNPIDSMKEFRDMVQNFLSYNTRMNWGIDNGTTHTDFKDAPNFATAESLRFITDYRTYNNIKKILPTIFHDDKLAQNLLGNDSNWIIVPTSYLEVNKQDSATINVKPTLVENFTLFTKESQRQKGTIMIIQKNDIKCAYNFEQNDAEYFAKNATTQVFMKKNLTLKPLKWCQVGVFQNEHLEDEFVIPTSSK